MRIDALDDFAVKLEDQPQHAVGRRMLRSEIDGEVARRGFGHQANSAHLRGFRRQARIELVPHHDKALVPAFADEIDAVMRLDLEGDARPGDLGAFDVDRHRLPRQESPRGG